jgi:hypothetical protein
MVDQMQALTPLIWFKFWPSHRIKNGKFISLIEFAMFIPVSDDRSTLVRVQDLSYVLSVRDSLSFWL